MGIFDALTTAVSGLGAQSYALQNIAGNIANSQTVAYKRINTSFEDLIGDNLPSKQIAGGVLASSISTNNVQGDLQNSSISTYMAINGNGYFIVQRPDNFSGNQPVFGGVNLYTRRGDFQMDKNGYLVNQAGYYLMGLPVDPTTGNPVGSVPVVLQFNNNMMPAVATTQILYNANLPSQPITANTQSGVPASSLLDPLTFVASPVVGTAQPAAITGSGATLSADAAAVLTGTTDISALSSAGGTLVINGTGITVNSGDGAAQVLAAINAQTATTGVSAALNGSNQLELTSADALTAINIGAGSSGGLLTELGLSVGITNPTNLLTQGAVAQGQTLVLTVGSGSPQTITFGTGGGEIATLQALNSALQGLTGVNPATTGVNLANGTMTITAANTSDVLVLGGTFNPAMFGVTSTQGFPANGTVFGTDVTNFVNQTVAGGSITAYDGVGAPVNVQFRWAKVDSVLTGGTDTWNLFYQMDSNPDNTDPAWINAGVDFVFDATGQLNPAISSLTLNNVTIDSISLGSVSLAFGSGGLTQFANANGTVQVNLLDQNGAPAGQLQGVAVDDQGRVIGTYSNGRIVPLAVVTLANFNGQNYLKRLDGGAYAETAESGPAILNATGKIVGSSLESSNSDIADEFSKLIVTQQAYSANTRIITTTNQMVQDLLNVIR